MTAAIKFGIRNMNQQATKTVVINGVGNLGRQVAIQALKQGAKVIGVVRNPQTANELTNHGMNIEVASEAQMQDRTFWQKFFETKTAGENVSVIQTVGLATASTPEKLANANINTPVAMAKGLEAAQNSLHSSRFIQFSTLAADMVPNSGYGATKLEAEKQLQQTNLNNLLLLRIGYAVPALEEGNDYEGIDEKHAYAPWQFSALPSAVRIHPIVGSGTQLLQPLHSDEIAKAALNFETGHTTVTGVGSSIVSQKDFARFYADLAGVSFHPMYLPYDVAKPLSHHFEEGHLAEYAVDACKLLETETFIYSPDGFAKLLGRKPKSLNEIYETKNNKPIIYTQPPIIEHGTKILKTLYSNPKARADLYHIMRDHGFTLVKDFLKA